MPDKPEKFGLILGEGGKPQDPKKVERQIKVDTARSHDMSDEEYLELRSRMDEQKLRMVKQAVLHQHSRLLNDREAEFITDRILGILSGKTAAREAIVATFPELENSIDNIIAEVNSYKNEI